LKDVYAFRVITESIEQCYIALGLLHSNYKETDTYFRDYISNPKDNGYKSIHTVLNYHGSDLEVQIRTKEMHEFNEFGPASHIAYKLMGAKDATDAYTWTKDLVLWKKKDKLSKEDFKVQAFTNSIFVFTPKGLVIQLPEGSTPLDFAFRIHTNMGYYYRGALVNERMVSMSHQLHTGDVVDILLSKTRTVTSDWLKNCVSKTAQSRIRRFLRTTRK
jgi:guanosine-3',5'-bis(diphosphate) 3'-pyrophosphohydrolase